MPRFEKSPHPVLYEIHPPTKVINYIYEMFHVCPSQHQRKDMSPLSCFSFSMFHSSLINICYSHTQLVVVAFQRLCPLHMHSGVTSPVEHLNIQKKLALSLLEY